MQKYRLVNNIFGWFCFLVAFITYILTLEPTVSLWDCGEFIATSYRLEIGHPPGAPFYMILGRIATLFVSNPENIAVVVNGLSALVSALTILFLFWTITHLAKKLIWDEKKDNKLSHLIAIMGAGLVGALAFTFSDTFWFSAVEAEVYSMSSFFTAITFWAILKWEDVADEPYANRWIVFIAYLLGLSIGVHLLNLLAIPAIAFVYYFKKYKVTKWGLIKTFIISILLLVILMYGIIQGLVSVAAGVELFFVNSLGLPFNSGVIFFIIFLFTISILGIFYTYKKGWVLWNTILTSFFVIIIGYYVFTIIPIRSAANPPMDTSNPENVFNLKRYLNREQYGDRPLFFGTSFNVGRPIGIEKKSPVYIKKNSKYDIVDYSYKGKYDSNDINFFPRMYSQEKRHIYEYINWGGVDQKSKTPISFGKNLRFFINYQFGQMYFRYFMWNFVGKQNNIYRAGQHNIFYANWLSGISFIDNYRLGNQEKVPSRLKNDPSRNTYYFLPLIFGLLGIFFQLSLKGKGKNGFITVFLLFFFTGTAIVLYINQTPMQPRERDYSYVGSFYAFAIWIGLGVLSIYNFLLKQKISSIASTILIIIISLLVVPLLMAKENWKDHDRSGRYLARDIGSNYLNTCEKNAIIFTAGDNDTFPLWYIQDVEGVRTDVKVCNLSYLSAGWYIEQLDRKAFNSERIPFTLSKENYYSNILSNISLIEKPNSKRYSEEHGGFQLENVLKHLKKISSYRNPQRIYLNNELNSKKFVLPVNKEKVLRHNIISPENSKHIVDNLYISYNKNNLYKNNILALDAIVGSNWDRPIYFAVGIGIDNLQGFENYTQLEGLAHRLVPINFNKSKMTISNVNTEKMYDNFVNKFNWGGYDKPGVTFRFTNADRMKIINIRNQYHILAKGLIKEKKYEKALKTIDKFFSIFHIKNIPLLDDFNIRQLLEMIQFYYELGAKDKARQWAKFIAKDRLEYIDYYFSLLSNQKFASITKNNRDGVIQELNFLLSQLYTFDDLESYNEVKTNYENLLNSYNIRRSDK